MFSFKHNAFGYIPLDLRGPVPPGPLPQVWKWSSRKQLVEKSVWVRSVGGGWAWNCAEMKRGPWEAGRSGSEERAFLSSWPCLAATPVLSFSLCPARRLSQSDSSNWGHLQKLPLRPDKSTQNLAQARKRSRCWGCRWEGQEVQTAVGWCGGPGLAPEQVK